MNDVEREDGYKYCSCGLCEPVLGFPSGVPEPELQADASGLVAAVEAVKHPSHYGGDVPYEAIKVMEAWAVKWASEGVPPEAVINLVQVLKYLSRHKVKGKPLQDLKKARWYLDRVTAGLGGL